MAPPGEENGVSNGIRWSNAAGKGSEAFVAGKLMPLKASTWILLAPWLFANVALGVVVVVAAVEIHAFIVRLKAL